MKRIDKIDLKYHAARNQPVNQPLDENSVPQLQPPFVEGTFQQLTPGPAVKPKVHKDQPEIPGYEFLKRLGKGGMGVVWLCKDIRAGRLVALKQTISDELSEYDRQRFRTEAQAMAKLQHPNIVHVFEVNEHEGRRYFTMDYCPGGSLYDYLDRKPQPAKICAEIVEKLALGVQHAHENGIIHRDLKPANVLLNAEFGMQNADAKSDSDHSSDKEQRQRFFESEFRNPNSAFLKLTDFGLAKNTEASQQFTRTESVMGTPSYMSPEQGKETKSAGPAADVWSLGVILYECITGSLPFVGADLIEVLDNIRSKDPVPPSEKVKCPRDLETICLKCLRKDPRDRYATAQKLADDLHAFGEERSISARPMGKLEKSAKWVRRNPSWAAMISLFLMTLLTATSLSLNYAEEKKRLSDKLQTSLELEEEAGIELANKAEQLSKTVAELNKEQEKTKSALKSVEEKNEELLESLAQNRIQLAEAEFNGAGFAGAANELLNGVPERFRNWEWGFLKRKYQGSFATIYGHSRPVLSVSVSPDGSRIVSGSSDRTVRVWDVKTGTQLLKLTGHSHSVSSVAFSPDGTKIASGSRDKTIRIWDSSTGQSLYELRGHTAEVHCVAFNPNGMSLASYAFDKSIRIWEMKSRQSLIEIKDEMLPEPGSLVGQMSQMSFSPDGQSIATGLMGGKCGIWDTKTGQRLLTLGHEFGGFYSIVAFNPDGLSLASETWDGIIQIWDVKTRKIQRELISPNKGSIDSVAFSPDGTQVVSAGSDRTIRVWDINSGRNTLSLKEPNLGVSRLLFTPDGLRLISIGLLDSAIRIWDARSGISGAKFQVRRIGFPEAVRSIAFNPDGSQFASASDNGTISGTGTLRIWDTKNVDHRSNLRGDLSKDFSQNMCVSFSRDGSKLASGSLDQSIRIWDAITGGFLLQLKGHSGDVSSVSFSPDGSQLVSGSADNTVRIWDTKTGKSLMELQGHSSSVCSVAFSPDGSQIASGSLDKSIRMWDATTGKCIRTLVEPNGGVTSIAFNKDGSQLVSGCRGGTVRVWDIKTGKIGSPLKGHTQGVSCVSFSPDGSRIASGSADTTIRIWDAKTGNGLLQLNGHTREVLSLAFNRDGTRIISGSGDPISADGGEIIIWAAKENREPIKLIGHTAKVECLAISRDFQLVATGSEDKSIRIWDPKSGKSLLELEGHTASVIEIAFNPDHINLVSRSKDNTIRLWDTSSGKEVSIEKEWPQWANGTDPVNDTDRKFYWMRGDDNIVSLIPLDPSPAELGLRRVMSHSDPFWHREQLRLARHPFAASVQNYLLYKATFEEHFDSNRFDQAFYWSVAAQVVKPKPPVIDWPELLPKPM